MMNATWRANPETPTLGCMSAYEPFAVWAPYPQDVRLRLGEDTLPMRRISADWWVADQIAEPGMRYGFELHDGNNWAGPFPDPRTTSQPDGIHGLSEVTDPAYDWTSDNWTGRDLAGQVIYELHVGTFTPEGTFEGVIEKLGYLRDLGVTAIELMPVQPFGGDRNWGYDGVDWMAVHHTYGGPDGLKKLVDAAHNAGIGVILDVVYNHFGPDGNYNGMYGPYTSGGTTGWGEVVNISGPHSDEVRAFLVSVAAEIGRLQERERQLEAELREAREEPATTELDDETVTKLLGEETLRVLRPGGLLIMQEVGARNLQVICSTFGCGPGGEYAHDPEQTIYRLADPPLPAPPRRLRAPR